LNPVRESACERAAARLLRAFVASSAICAPVASLAAAFFWL
jgi:hypothetical protein